DMKSLVRVMALSCVCAAWLWAPSANAQGFAIGGPPFTDPNLAQLWLDDPNNADPGPGLLVFVPPNFGSDVAGALKAIQDDLMAFLQDPATIQSLAGMLISNAQSGAQQYMEGIIVPDSQTATPISNILFTTPDLTSNPLFVATPTGHQPFTTLFTHIEPSN